MKIISFIERGNSFPVILEDQGKQYFVKLRAGMSGKYGLVTEWFGNQLGQHININTQNPIWINLDENISFEGLHLEVQELISKSLGINIGFKFHPDTRDLNVGDLNAVSIQAAAEIFLFDLMMINIDRTPQNMNLMSVGDELLSVDYESSLLFQSIIGEKNLLNDHRVLKCLRHNPLYSQIDESVIDAFISRVNIDFISEVISEIPSTLLSDKDRRLFFEGVKAKQSEKWLIKETLEQLKAIEIESKAEQKRRFNKNQEAFLRKFKKNKQASS